ncbi:MAG: YceI family protein [Aureibaculum sp.]
MKKFITTTTVILVAFIAFSFTSLETITKEVKIEKSKVTWKGYKVTGSHEGTIAIQSGTLKFEADVLVGGEFVIDMTSITNADLQGEYKDKLEGHLKSDDFFGVEKFPTATLVFKNVEVAGKNSYKVTGDLTIKGKTNPVTFDFSVYGSKANATLKIDRSKYDVKYGSSSFFDNLKDKVIYDEFDLISDLEF